MHDSECISYCEIGSQAMKHLMIKRPLDVDRTEFFPQAETFAAMVKLEFVLMPGRTAPDGSQGCC